MCDMRHTKSYQDNRGKAYQFLSQLHDRARTICPNMFFFIKVISNDYSVNGVYISAHHESKTIATEKFVPMADILYFRGEETLSNTVVKDIVDTLYKYEKRL